MEILNVEKEFAPYCSRRYSEYFGGLSVAVIDIETTGLSPVSSKCILGGVAFPSRDHLEVRQFFAEQKKEEAALLLSYCSLLSDSDVLVSYNGNGFDLPFLRSRLDHYGLFDPLRSCFSCDLYRAVRHYSPFRGFLPNLKQKTVEQYLGIGADRKDTISGEESVKLYEEYLKTGSPNTKEMILLHNSDDLVQLSRLLAVLDKLDLHRILYHEGFPVLEEGKRAVVHSLSFARQSLCAAARTSGITGDYYSFEAGWQASHLSGSGTLSVEIPTESLKDAVYADLSLLPLPEGSFSDLAGESSGYLVLKDKDGIRFQESNRLVKSMVGYILRQL